MKRGRTRTTLLGAAVILLVVASFQAGRRAVIVRREWDDAARRSAANSATQRSTKVRSDSEEDQKIHLENLAVVSFAELYDLVRSASAETRSTWAKQLEGLPGSPRRLAAIESFYKTLVQLDAHTAMQLVLEMNDRRAQAIALAAIVGTVREADLKLVADMQMELPADRRIVTSLMGEWIQVDPQNATEFIEHYRDRFSSKELYSLIVTWAIRDPTAAKAWLDRLDPADQTSSAISGVVLGWAERDRAAAVEYAAAHAGSKEFHDALVQIAESMFRESPDEAGGLIAQLSGGGARDAMIQALVDSATGKTGLSLNSPEDVAKWLVALPNSIGIGHVSDLLAVWEKQNAAGALSWIEELPVETRAQLLTEYSPHGDGIASERAFALALHIPDRKLRDAALRKFAESLGTTREEALRSLQELDVSAAQKRYLRSFLKFE